ncbi:MAG TPA: NrfD/PsrC family molybdoenzyme membrane anchor subunit, partial [Terriglobia bacterium]|nr:NrfD/PsrC family molybdoenzyme membrane anchor subunit [Terriglobia bacterium]
MNEHLTERRGASEERLAEIRREASGFGRRNPPGPSGQHPSLAAAQTGYYGLPLLKPPQWRWEVPAYFFLGGAAGAAAVIAGVGELCRADGRLVRDARWVAALGGAASPLFLISDLGRPSRFLGMMRVFKLRSPMSVGSWTLAVFSSAAAGALISDIARERGLRLAWIGIGARTLATVTGLPLASYTGVLLGATAIPVWSA